MPADVFQLAILGSGFGGTLLAMIASRLGLRTLIVDRHAHPRFAIGESSTPAADVVLESLAHRYGLDRVLPLARYGSVCDTYPALGNGCKRGFSYFGHTPHREFQSGASNENQLLVAASGSDAQADTHWYRQSVDHLLRDICVEQGVSLEERVSIRACRFHQRWKLSGERFDESGEIIDRAVEYEAEFIVDATGNAGALTRLLGVPRTNCDLATSSRAVFGHFQNVLPWQEVLDELSVASDEHPFPCDLSAMHHLLDEGWMWQLRFEHGVTSLGYVLVDTPQADGRSHPDPPTFKNQSGTSVDDARVRFDAITHRYPSLSRQLKEARAVTPGDTIRSTDRMQFIVGEAAGQRWASLPSAAGFIDALHSTGIAHTLVGIERLSRALEMKWLGPAMTDLVAEHGQATLDEIRFVDDLVSMCYLARDDFDAWSSACMFYFASAHSYETLRSENASSSLSPGANDQPGFLCADDAPWRQHVRRAKNVFAARLRNREPAPDVKEWTDHLRGLLAPKNKIGLLAPDANGMYRHTVAPFKA